MFTGVIDEIGDFVGTSGSSHTFSAPPACIEELEIGGSISVNGICLTAVEVDGNNGRFTADISSETKTRTSIGDLRPGDKVNLELPLEVSGVSSRLDGHLVQGHVDTLGKVGTITREKGNYLFRISTSREFGKYLVEKGSVAVDGISLTPYRIAGGSFTVAVIPHTYEATTLQFTRSGAKVNVEFDILAKYIRNSVKDK